MLKMRRTKGRNYLNIDGKYVEFKDIKEVFKNEKCNYRLIKVIKANGEVEYLSFCSSSNRLVKELVN